MIKVISIEDNSWERIVRSFSHYDVYYLPEYVKAFQKNGDGTPVLFYYENKEKTGRAINVVMKRDLYDVPEFRSIVEQEKYYDIITPYGYGGWIVEGSNAYSLKDEYEDYCRRHHIVSEFVRFHPVLENWKGLDVMYTDIHLGDTVCIDISSKELVWNNFKSQNRSRIRKAQNNGLKVYWGRYPELIDPFIAIYNDTMKRDDAEEYYFFQRPFYESILEDLKDNSLWFFATKDGVIAGICIFLFCGDIIQYHLSASREEYEQMAPTNLIIYEAAVFGCEHGYKKLHLGGGVGSGHDTLYRFKKTFNQKGEDKEFHIGKKIFDVEMYDTLCRAKGVEGHSLNLLESGYFPEYRGGTGVKSL